MISSTAQTRVLVDTALNAVGASVIEDDGILTCVLPSSSRLAELLGSSQVRLAFVGTITSASSFPSDVQIVMPGSAALDAFTQFAEEQAVVAVVARRNGSHVLRPLPPIDWQGCVVDNQDTDTVGPCWQHEHYFKVRLMSQTVEELILCASLVPDLQLVSIRRVADPSLADYEELAHGLGGNAPSKEAICRAVAQVERSLRLWIDREIAVRETGLLQKRREAELRLRAYYDRMSQERLSKETSLLKQIRQPKAQDSARRRLVELHRRHQIEAEQEAAELEGRLEELNRRFQIWGTDVYPVGYALVWAPVSITRVVLRRAAVEGTAFLLHASHPDDEAGVLCASCLHLVRTAALCEHGHVACDRCLIECESCGIQICDTCSPRTCHVCNRTVGPECLVSCGSCHTTVCRDDAVLCGSCHAVVCTQCAVTCKGQDCSELLCQRCAEEMKCVGCGGAYCEQCAGPRTSCGHILCGDCQRGHICGLCEAPICPLCEHGRIRCSVCGLQLCTRCAGKAAWCRSCGTLRCSADHQSIEPALTCLLCGQPLCPDCGRSSSTCRLCRLRAKHEELTEEESTGERDTEIARVVKYLVAVGKRRGRVDGADVFEACSAELPWVEEWAHIPRVLRGRGIRLGIRSQAVHPLQVLTAMLPMQLCRRGRSDRSRSDGLPCMTPEQTACVAYLLSVRSLEITRADSSLFCDPVGVFRALNYRTARWNSGLPPGLSSFLTEIRATAGSCCEAAELRTASAMAAIGGSALRLAAAWGIDPDETAHIFAMCEFCAHTVMADSDWQGFLFLLEWAVFSEIQRAGAGSACVMPGESMMDVIWPSGFAPPVGEDWQRIVSADQEFLESFPDERSRSSEEYADTQLLSSLLAEIMSVGLSRAERDVLSLMYLGSYPRTAVEVGRHMQMTASAVRRVRAKALKKLRHAKRRRTLEYYVV